MNESKRIAEERCMSLESAINISLQRFRESGLDEVTSITYLVALLLYKYVSDAANAHGSFSAKSNLQRSQEYHQIFLVPYGWRFNDLYERRWEENVDELLDMALDSVQKANKQLNDIFGGISFAKPPHRLRSEREWVDSIAYILDLLYSIGSLSSEEMNVGECYDQILSRLAMSKKSVYGQFYTPIGVADLLVELTAPAANETVYDPACGFGTVLIRSHRKESVKLFGEEAAPRAWQIARMSMHLHKIEDANIAMSNSILHPSFVAGKRLSQFDVVVSNPPVGMRSFPRDVSEGDVFNRFVYGLPARSQGEWAFISHMLASANEDTGRVAVVVPHGTLFRGGADARIRKALLDENLIDAVIGLPGGLFATTTMAVAVLLFDKRRRTTEKDGILFVNAANKLPGRDARREEWLENLRPVLSEYRKGTVNIPKAAYPTEVISRADVATNDYTLNISTYVPAESLSTDSPDIIGEIDALEREIVTVRERLTRYAYLWDDATIREA